MDKKATSNKNNIKKPSIKRFSVQFTREEYDVFKEHTAGINKNNYVRNLIKAKICEGDTND